MPSNIANNSTLTFAGATFGCYQDWAYDRSASEISASCIGDDEDIFEPGMVEKVISATVFGIPAFEVGDKGTVVCTFVGTNTVAFTETNMCCFSKEPGGTKDGMVTTKVAFEKSEA